MQTTSENMYHVGAYTSSLTYEPLSTGRISLKTRKSRILTNLFFVTTNLSDSVKELEAVFHGEF